MSINISKGDWIAFGWVLFLGGIAASAREIREILAEDFVLRFDPWLISVEFLLGGMAALIFLFVLTNTNRDDFLRISSFALLAGFFAQPVFDLGEVFIQQRSEERALASGVASIEQLSRLREEVALGEINPQEARENAAIEIRDLGIAWSGVRTPEAINQLGYSQAQLFEWQSDDAEEMLTDFDQYVLPQVVGTVEAAGWINRLPGTPSGNGPNLVCNPQVGIVWGCVGGLPENNVTFDPNLPNVQQGG